MAYLVRRSGDSVEIRESRSTPRGPRSRQLTRFSGALTPGAVARASAAATRPFDPEALVRRARVLGIPVDGHSQETEARALLARLRRGDPIDPVMAGLLARAIDALSIDPIPEHLSEVGEWIGATTAERGAVLRDLLDTFGRIEQSRPSRRRRPRSRFPHFSSAITAAAS